MVCLCFVDIHLEINKKQPSCLSTTCKVSEGSVPRIIDLELEVREFSSSLSFDFGHACSPYQLTCQSGATTHHWVPVKRCVYMYKSRSCRSSRWRHTDRTPNFEYIFAPQVGLILSQSPTVGPIYHRRRTTPRLPHDDTLPRRHQSNIILIPYSLFSPIEPIDTT